MKKFPVNLHDAFSESRRLGICKCASLQVYAEKIGNLQKKVENDIIDDYEDRFKVLANSSRLKIIGFLIKQQRSCICEIVTVFAMDRGTLSYHLKMLKNIGLIKMKKVGKSKLILLTENYKNILPKDVISHFTK